MPKILMLGPQPPPFGGVVSVMNEITHSSLASAYDFDVFATSGGNQTADHGTLQAFSARVRKFARFFRKVVRGRYCLVHVHTGPRLRGAMVYIVLARAAGAKVILQIHHSHWNHVLVRGATLPKLIVRECLNLVSEILVMNSSWFASFADLGIRTKVTLVRNFLGAQDPAASGKIPSSREELGLTEQNFVVITVGALVKGKGIYDTLDAVPSSVEADDDIRFLFVGGGARPGDEASFRDEIHKRGLSKWVIATGETDRDHVSAFLGLGDLFLLPSHAESMPVSILEAMRSGLAIVATPVGSVPKMIDQGNTGLLVPVGSPDSIAKAVLHLRTHADERDRLGAGARKAFEQQFLSSSSLTELESIYALHCRRHA